MRLTIILTVYNKKPYLERAFDALLEQKDVSKDDYEILAVDDGSTDGSSSIIEDYSKNNSRIRVLSQDNQGLSMARNNGVANANGEYVWFVDADDIVSPKSVSWICCAIAQKPDIIPIYAITEGEKVVRNEVPVSAKDGKDILKSKKWEPCGVFNVFRRAFLEDNSLRFVPGIFHEDAEFTPRMLFAAKNVVVVPEILYTVIHEPNSITQIPRPKRAFDYLVVSESLNCFMDREIESDKELKTIFSDIISTYINNAFNIIIKNSKEEQTRYNNTFLEKRHLINILKNSSKFKYRIEGYLFKLFPKNYVATFRFLKIFH